MKDAEYGIKSMLVGASNEVIAIDLLLQKEKKKFNHLNQFSRKIIQNDILKTVFSKNPEFKEFVSKNSFCCSAVP